MAKSRKPFIKHLLGLRSLFVINVIVIAFISLSFGREFMRHVDIQQDVQALEEQSEALAARNLQLTELHTAIQTESFIEREARLKLGMSKPGENVVIVTTANESQEEGMTTSQNTILEATIQKIEDGYLQEEVGNASKWWNYFFNKIRYQQIKQYEQS